MSRVTPPRPEVTFALRLANALHRYGTPAHRLEDVLVALSERLGVKGSFFSTPTALFASFEGGGDESTHMQRFQESETNLGKLADLDALFNDVWFGRRGLEEAAAAVDAVMAAPPRYGAWSVLASFVLASGSAARFFGGGAAEMGLAAAAGLALGGVVRARARLPLLRRLFEPLGAFVVTLIAVLGAHWLGASADQAVLGGLIVMVPGFTLTTAVTELATGHLVSGTARLAAAGILLLLLGFGVMLGQHVGGLLGAGTGAGTGAAATAAVASVVALPPWTVYALLPVAGCAIALLFQAPAREFIWILAISVAGFLGVRLGLRVLGPELGVFLGALVVGAGSNLYARLLDRPASVTRLPGMLFLVPGGFSFLSISSLMRGDALHGLTTAFQVATILTALVVGFLLSNALVPPRKIL